MIEYWVFCALFPVNQHVERSELFTQHLVVCSRGTECVTHCIFIINFILRSLLHPPPPKNPLKTGGTVCDIGLWLQSLTPAVDNHLKSKTTYSFIFVFICLSRKYLWRVTMCVRCHLKHWRLSSKAER